MSAQSVVTVLVNIHIIHVLIHSQTLMSAVRTWMSVMTMPAVLTHWETTTVPVTLDMREMDSPALVHTHISVHIYIRICICMHVH